jgi:hypothetical protein
MAGASNKPFEWSVQVVLDPKPPTLFDWKIQVRDRIKVATMKEMKEDRKEVGFSSEFSKVVHAHNIPRSCSVEELIELCRKVDENASHCEAVSKSNLKLLECHQNKKLHGRPVYYLTVGALTSFKIRMKKKSDSGDIDSVILITQYPAVVLTLPNY